MITSTTTTTTAIATNEEMARVIVEMPEDPVPGECHHTGSDVFHHFRGGMVVVTVVVSVGGGRGV